MLKLTGGGEVVAATAPLAGCSGVGISQAARGPWRTAGQYDDPRKGVLSCAMPRREVELQLSALEALRGWLDKDRED